MGLTDGSKWVKIAALLVALTLLLHMIAMGSTWWAKSDETVQRKEHIGLWRYCTDVIGGGSECDPFVDIIMGDWLKAAQAFSILALFTLLGAVALVALLVFVPDYEDDSRMLMITIAVSGCAALFQLIEVGTMGATYQEYFKNKDPEAWGYVGEISWAWGVACAGMVLNFVAIVLLVIEMASGSKDAF